MNEKLTSNNIENNYYSKRNSDSDYQILIDKLREIKTNIALFEKTILK